MEPCSNFFESSCKPRQLPTMAAMPTTTTDSATRRFAVACGVLSQYVRAGAPPFLQAPAAGGAVPLPAAEAPPQQLKIFYGGKVVVLDACPPEKAAELIRLAAAAQVAPAPVDAAALVDMPIARKASLRRFLAKRKDRSSSSSAAFDRQQDDDEPEPLPEPEPQQQPAAKKGKTVVASRDEASSSSSWLALGLGGTGGAMHGR